MYVNSCRGAASLEFWTTYKGRELLPALARADQALRSMVGSDEAVAEQTESESGSSLVDEVAVEEESAMSGYDRKRNPLFALLDPMYAYGSAVGAASEGDMAKINEYLELPAVRDLLPNDVKFMWSIKGSDYADGRYTLYAIKVDRADGKAPLDGSVVTDAREMYAEQGAVAEVSMTMNADGVQGGHD